LLRGAGSGRRGPAILGLQTDARRETWFDLYLSTKYL
jgi:hypothetical protein